MIALKQYQECVKSCAKPDQWRAVEVQIEAMLSEPHEEEVLEAPIDFADLPQLGSEASDSYYDMTKEHLLKSLGFPGELLVGMSDMRDIYRVYDKWDTDSAAQTFWKNPPEDRLEPITLTWHQLVGVHCATVSMVKREAFFLFDAVGIGKTAQSAGVVLMRAWLILYQRSHNKLPTALGELSFNSSLPAGICYGSKAIGP